jgi:DNA-binding transcriptional regulator YiaG
VEPAPDAIQSARAQAGHTQTEAGRLVGGTLRTWQDWEHGKRPMPHAAWELYRLLTGQHPEWVLQPRNSV